jgi:hypothetical protein
MNKNIGSLRAFEGGVVCRRNIVGRGVRKGRKYVLTGGGWAPPEVRYGATAIDEIQDSNECYVPTDVVHPDDLAGAWKGATGAELLWLPDTAASAVRITKDFERRVWCGADEPYRAHIPAGSRVFLVRAGNAASAARWGIIYPSA